MAASTVIVPAAVAGQVSTNPDYVHINQGQIRAACVGHTVNIHIDRPGDEPKLYPAKKWPIHLLCAMSPAVKDAVDDSGIPLEQITDVILPHGEQHGYTYFLASMEGAITNGIVFMIEKDYETPLYTYSVTLDVLKKLAVIPLATDLAGRLESMVRHMHGYKYFVAPKDVRAVYRKYGPEDALKKDLVNSLASAWEGWNLSKQNRTELEALGEVIPEFWDEWTNAINALRKAKDT